MANKYIVDTHALIWFLEGNTKLGKNAKDVLSDPDSDMVLPMIALAEAIDVVAKNRTELPDVTSLLNDVLADHRIEFLPLTLAILQQSLSATAVPEMHDRLIVATAMWLKQLGHQVAILTKDQSIIDAGLTPIVW
ncbi:MAG: type II toxin-antitoxin system VapC family toxin [Blastocatellia bacterium]